MEGYYNVPRSETFDATDSSHRRSGYLDEDGNLHFAGAPEGRHQDGRRQRRCRRSRGGAGAPSGGQNGARRGRADPARGENVVALVVLRAGQARPPTIYAVSAARALASYKVPRHVFVIADEAYHAPVPVRSKRPPCAKSPAACSPVRLPNSEPPVGSVPGRQAQLTKLAFGAHRWRWRRRRLTLTVRARVRIVRREDAGNRSLAAPLLCRPHGPHLGPLLVPARDLAAAEPASVECGDRGRPDRAALAASGDRPGALHRLRVVRRRRVPRATFSGVIDGKARLVNPTHCIGHGACKAACPTTRSSSCSARRRGVDIPVVSPNFETNVPGIFIAGELGGMGLIRNAVEQGRQAIESIAQAARDRRRAGLRRRDRRRRARRVSRRRSRRWSASCAS